MIQYLIGLIVKVYINNYHQLDLQQSDLCRGGGMIEIPKVLGGHSASRPKMFEALKT